MKKIILFLVINLLSFGGYYIDYRGVLYDTIFDNKVYDKLYIEKDIKMTGGINKGSHACVAHFEDMTYKTSDKTYILINFKCDVNKLKGPKQRVAYKTWTDVIRKGYPIIILSTDVTDETPGSLGIWYFDIEMK